MNMSTPLPCHSSIRTLCWASPGRAVRLASIASSAAITSPRQRKSDRDGVEVTDKAKPTSAWDVFFALRWGFGQRVPASILAIEPDPGGGPDRDPNSLSTNGCTLLFMTRSMRRVRPGLRRVARRSGCRPHGRRTERLELGDQLRLFAAAAQRAYGVRAGELTHAVALAQGLQRTSGAGPPSVGPTTAPRLRRLPFLTPSTAL
ncbi:MAG: hypothetical protein M5U31_16445 [Acidimicrobiia bacterium]|nr:hypothetical protein [Acidimicrobiia bacterium]